MFVQVKNNFSVLLLGVVMIGCGNSNTAEIGVSDASTIMQGSEESSPPESEANPQSVNNQTPMTESSGVAATNLVQPDSDPTSQQNEDVNVVTDGPEATVGLAVNGYVVVQRTRTWSDSSSQLINTLDYDYTNNQIVVSKSYSNRNTAAVTQSLMTYDELGNWTSLEDLNISSPFVLNRTEFLYNSQGYLVNGNSYFVSDGSQYTASETSYLSDGRFDSHIDKMRNSLLKAEYNSNKQLVKISTFNDISANSTVSYSLTYNFTNDNSSMGVQRVRVASVTKEGDEWSGHELFYFNDIGNLEVRESYNTDGTLRYKDEFLYELSPEPVFNYWLHHLRFVPDAMLYPFPRV